MKFLDIVLAAGEANSANPRTAPADVDDKLVIVVPKCLDNTDTPPTRLLVTLEGTATQTVAVVPWVQAEPPGDTFDVPQARADRRFYQVGASETVTVGNSQELPAFVGKMYLQISSAPAAASVLRISFAP